MSARLFAMRFYPVYLRFELPDPLVQFVLRIWGEIFASELARSVPFDSREIVVIHQKQHRKRACLLSMDQSGIRTVRGGGMVCRDDGQVGHGNG